MGAVFWVQQAKADIPSTTVVIDDTGVPTTGASSFDYTATFTFIPSGTQVSANPAVFTLTVDADLVVDPTASPFASGDIGPIEGDECVYAAGVITCTDNDAVSNWTDGVLTFNFWTPPAGGTISPPTLPQNNCLTDGGNGAGNCTAGTLSGVTDVAPLVTVDPLTATNALGLAETFTFTLPADVTCQSDPDLVPAGGEDTDTDVDCSAADIQIVNNAGASCEILSGPTVGDPDLADASTVVVEIVGSDTGNCTITLLVTLLVDDPNDGLQQVDAVSQAATKTFVEAELRHMADVCASPDNAIDGCVIDSQEINFNVIGSRHTVCTIADNDHGDPNVGVIIPLDADDINVQSGGGYLNTTDDEPTLTSTQFFTVEIPEGSGNDATCFSWVSTGAGDQEINVSYVGDDGITYDVNWDQSDNDNGIGSGTNVNDAVIKEWNVLEASQLFINGVSQGSAQDVAKVVGLVLNPATGDYEIPGGGVAIDDIFIGSHTNRAGQKEGPLSLAGVDWEVDLDGCGDLEGEGEGPEDHFEGTTALAGDEDWNDQDTNDINQPIVVNTPSVFFTPGEGVDNCGPGDSALITFVGTCPGVLGSGECPVVEESVLLTFSFQQAQKQTLLAWAGQRVLLEHDWRIPPGDVFDPEGEVEGAPVGECPWDDATPFSFIKGSGPGNFISGLDAIVHGNDQATVFLGGDPIPDLIPIGAPIAQVSAPDSDAVGVADSDQVGDAPLDPQDSCITRVLYESEDPGQVDIELFETPGDLTLAFFLCLGFDIGDQVTSQQIPTPDEIEFCAGLLVPVTGPTVSASKVSFVVYYMKLNRVNVSLVTQVSKPNHNGTNSDFAPGNPWNATLDDADNAAEWNVSRDLLVRVRVSGFFNNANPSGRAQDATDPLNVLPANRWVLPEDWPLLGGGPPDPADGTDAVGTAESFRPQMDILFAPNNTRGIALTSPTGLTVSALTTVAVAGLGSDVSPIIVASAAQIVAGSCVSFTGGVTVDTVVAVVGNAIIIASPKAAAVAAGTIVFACGGVPFEGPYSLIDLPGLAANNPLGGGLFTGGAALSNILASASMIRDTILPDGDVDWWDAPMPPAQLTVHLRGTGFLKQVYKEDVYYLGNPNASGQLYPNPYYYSNIPAEPWIPFNVAGGGYKWNSWGNDGPQAAGGLASSSPPGTNGMGPYHFWQIVVAPGTNPETGALLDTTLTAANLTELAAIRAAYSDPSIGRDLTVYTDNHGEAMVIANGDFKTDLSACAVNTVGGGRHCKPGDHVGTASISATADYPDFRGKHFPVVSNTATVTWLWGGYKDVTVEAGEDPSIKYVVFHGLDRDGFCAIPLGAVSLHPVLSGAANDTFNGNPAETIDFLIDAGEGIILGQAKGGKLNLDGNRQFATGVQTFSTALNDPAVSGIKEFPLSPLATAGATDECQAWIRVANSLLGIVNVRVFANDDEGVIAFDRVIDLQNTQTITLNFRWSLVTWNGADNLPVSDALAGTGANEAGNDISAQVTAVYGWDAAAQEWLGYFPAGVNVPGANDLTALKTGQAYWIAIVAPGPTTWTIATNVGA
jgi:hypothetical protein